MNNEGGGVMRAFMMKLVAVLVAVTAWCGAERRATGQGPAPSPVRVHAELSSARVYVGDSVECTITVEGSKDAERPVLRLPEGLRSEFIGGTDRSSHFVSITNGVREERSSLGYAYQFRITAMREGEFTIPAPEVTVAGKVYRAGSARLSVVRPEQTEDFAVRIEVDSRELYVGEATRLRVVWTLGGNVRNPSFSPMAGLEEFEVATPRNRIPQGRARQDDRAVELELFGNPVVGMLGEAELHGKQARSVTFEQIIVARSAGSHTLGPMSIAFDAVVGERPRNFFSAPWDDNSITRRLSVMSEPITITVKDLPTAGRPADFSGLVGSYALKMSADPTSVSVGDPITLKLLADGPDPMDRVAAPDLAGVPGFERFKLSGEGWKTDSGTMPGPRAYSTMVRVGDARVTEIPAIEIPYFDPRDKVYKRAKAGPLALSVRATREVTAADAVGGVLRAPVSGVVAGVLDSAGPALVANSEDLSALRNEGGAFGVLVSAPLTIGVLGIGPAAFAFVAGLRLRRERAGRADAAVRRERREALRVVEGGTADAVTIGAALRRYAGAVLGVDAASVTPVDCGGERGADRGLTALAEVLADCDAARFGGRAVEGRELAERAVRALRREPGMTGVKA